MINMTVAHSRRVAISTQLAAAEGIQAAIATQVQDLRDDLERAEAALLMAMTEGGQETGPPDWDCYLHPVLAGRVGIAEHTPMNGVYPLRAEGWVDTANAAWIPNSATVELPAERLAPDCKQCRYTRWPCYLFRDGHPWAPLWGCFVCSTALAPIASSDGTVLFPPREAGFDTTRAIYLREPPMPIIPSDLVQYAVECLHNQDGDADEGEVEAEVQASPGAAAVTPGPSDDSRQPLVDQPSEQEASAPSDAATEWRAWDLVRDPHLRLVWRFSTTGTPEPATPSA